MPKESLSKIKSKRVKDLEREARQDRPRGWRMKTFYPETKKGATSPGVYAEEMVEETEEQKKENKIILKKNLEIMEREMLRSARENVAIFKIGGGGIIGGNLNVNGKASRKTGEIIRFGNSGEENDSEIGFGFSISSYEDKSKISNWSFVLDVKTNNNFPDRAKANIQRAIDAYNEKHWEEEEKVNPSPGKIYHEPAMEPEELNIKVENLSDAEIMGVVENESLLNRLSQENMLKILERLEAINLKSKKTLKPIEVIPSPEAGSLSQKPKESEVKKPQVETFSREFIKQQIESLLYSNSDRIRKVTNIKIGTENPETIFLYCDLLINAKKGLRLTEFLSPRIEISCNIKSTDGVISIYNLNITAKKDVKKEAESAMKPELGKISGLLKSYIEENDKQKRKVEKMEIKNGELVVTFE